MEVVSAGGVVILGNAVLLLKKINGDWVLPKGRIEENEEPVGTAVREVREETGVRAEALSYLGETQYDFKESWSSRLMKKRVLWYLMKAKSDHLTPQREEGFVDAKFIPFHRVEQSIRYRDERQMVARGIEAYRQLKG